MDAKNLMMWKFKVAVTAMDTQVSKYKVDEAIKNKRKAGVEQQIAMRLRDEQPVAPPPYVRGLFSRVLGS